MNEAMILNAIITVGSIIVACGLYSLYRDLTNPGLKLLKARVNLREADRRFKRAEKEYNKSEEL